MALPVLLQLLLLFPRSGGGEPAKSSECLLQARRENSLTDEDFDQDLNESSQQESWLESEFTESDASEQNQLCKVSLCKDINYGPGQCKGGQTITTRGVREVNLQFHRRRREQTGGTVSSVLVSSGCRKVELLDNDGDGDVLEVPSPGNHQLSGDFDNGVYSVTLYAAPKLTARETRVQCTLTLYQHTNYWGSSRTLTSSSYITGQSHKIDDDFKYRTSSLKLSDGCAGVTLTGTDSAGEMWVVSDRAWLPHGFADHVTAVKLYAKDYNMHPLQGRCPSGYKAVNGVGTPLTGDSKGSAQIHWIKGAPRSTTYDEAIAMCAATSKQLCSRAQICPLGHAGGETPLGGKRAAGMFVPVLDSENDWVEVGKGHWPSCQLHSELAGGAHGKPSWGTAGGDLSWRGEVCCSSLPTLLEVTAQDSRNLDLDSSLQRKSADAEKKKKEKEIASSPASPSQPALQSGLQVRAYYFKDPQDVPSTSTSLQGKTPNTTWVENTVNKTISSHKWPVLRQSTSFAVVWSGMIKIQEPGEYTFALHSEGMSRLIVNGRTLVSQDKTGKLADMKDGSVYLGPGFAGLNVEYFHASGKSGIMVKYSGPDTDEKQISLTSDVLFRRSIPGAAAKDVLRGAKAFEECDKRDDCCGVAETSDESWRYENQEGLLLIKCDVKETTNDKTWWASCVKADRQADMCNSIAQYTEHPMSWTQWEGIESTAAGSQFLSNFVQSTHAGQSSASASTASVAVGESCARSSECICGHCSQGKCFETCSDTVDGTKASAVPRKNTYWCDYGTPGVATISVKLKGGAWGKWGPEVRCPGRGKVVALRQRVQNHQGAGDDTAVNAVQFKCEDGTVLGSREGSLGSWSGWSYCDQGKHVNGFWIRSEGGKYVKGVLKHSSWPADDAAASDVSIQCSNGKWKVPGNGKKWGKWSNLGKCPAGYHVCGFRSRVEGPQGHWGDDSSLGNLKLTCCSVMKVPTSKCYAGQVRAVTTMLQDYSKLHASASKIEDVLVEYADKEITLLAMNAVAKKHGDGPYSTSWGKSIHQNYKEDSCRQKRTVEGLPASQFTGDCSNHNLYARYESWYDSLSADFQSELLKLGIASVAQDLKFDNTQDGKDVYYPWQDCFTDKEAIRKTMAETSAKLQQMFMQDPKQKKRIFNEVINTKPDLCQWRSFIDDHAISMTLDAFAEYLGDSAHLILTEAMKSDTIGHVAAEIYSDLGAVLRLLVIFSHNDGFPAVMWPDEYGTEVPTNVYVAAKEVVNNMQIANLLLNGHLGSSVITSDEAFGASFMDDRIGDACTPADQNTSCGPCGFCKGGQCFEQCFDTAQGTPASSVARRETFFCDYRGEKPKAICIDKDRAGLKHGKFKERVAAAKGSVGLSNEAEEQAALMLQYLEDTIPCAGLPETLCHGEKKKDAQKLYKLLPDMHKKTAKAGAELGHLVSDLGYCLDNKDCKVRHGWKRNARDLVSLLTNLYDAYFFEADVASKAVGVGFQAKDVHDWLKEQAAKDTKASAKALKNAADTTEDVSKSTKLSRVGGWFSKMFKKLGKSVKNAVGGVASKIGQSKYVSGVVTKMRSIGSKASKFVKDAIKNVKKLASNIITKAVKKIVSGIFQTALAAIAIWGIVTDFQDMVDFFEDGKIALGIFSVVQAVAGIVTTVTTIAGAVALAMGNSFAAGTAAGFFAGPLAPLIGAVVAILAAIGALIWSLLNPPPGNRDYGDQFCCFTYKLGVDPKYLQGIKPLTKFVGKTDQQCHGYANLLQVLGGSSKESEMGLLPAPALPSLTLMPLAGHEQEPTGNLTALGLSEVHVATYHLGSSSHPCSRAADCTNHGHASGTKWKSESDSLVDACACACDAGYKGALCDLRDVTTTTTTTTPVNPRITIRQPSEESGWYKHRSVTKDACTWIKTTGSRGIAGEWTVNDLRCGDNTRCLKWGLGCYAGRMEILASGVMVKAIKGWWFSHDYIKHHTAKRAAKAGKYDFWNHGWHPRVCAWKFSTLPGYECKSNDGAPTQVAK